MLFLPLIRAKRSNIYLLIKFRIHINQRLIKINKDIIILYWLNHNNPLKLDSNDEI